MIRQSSPGVQSSIFLLLFFSHQYHQYNHQSSTFRMFHVNQLEQIPRSIKDYLFLLENTWPTNLPILKDIIFFFFVDYWFSVSAGPHLKSIFTFMKSYSRPRGKDVGRQQKTDLRISISSERMAEETVVCASDCSERDSPCMLMSRPVDTLSLLTTRVCFNRDNSQNPW